MKKSISTYLVPCLLVGFLALGLLVPTQTMAQESLTFKVQTTTYAHGKLWYPPSAAMIIEADGQTNQFVADEAGLITFTVPVGTTSTWRLSLGNWQAGFRAEFNNGTLLVYNTGRNDMPQEYHLEPDGSYSLEYYIDAIYITNQSQANAPILGWLSQSASVGRIQKMIDLEEVARWWSYVDPENPDHTIWLDWTLANQGEFQGLMTIYNPDNTQDRYHFTGIYSVQDGNLNFAAYHRNRGGEVDYEFQGHLISSTSGTGTITLPDRGTTTVTGTGWQVDPRGDGGGAENHFGGGGPYSRILGNQQLSAEINNARANGTEHDLNRILPLSDNYASVSSVVVQWLEPGANAMAGPDELALGGSGTLTNGITWQANLAYNYKVKLVDLRQTLPASFLSGLKPGVHTIKYWLKDAEGRLSNMRSETVEII